MEKVFLTCPFTGASFQAFEREDKLYFARALDHEMYSVTYDKQANCYIIPKELFRHVEIITPGGACEILNVSRARISQLLNDEIIPAHLVNDQPMFILSDVLEYKENRKPGRPRKED